jgi:hypothetical protein
MIIYGWKQYAQVLAVLTLVCKQCAMPAEHVVRRITTKFTLFFIPLFPVGRKHTLTCSSCEAVVKVSREHADQLAMGGGQPAQVQAPFTGPPNPAPQHSSAPPMQGPPPMQPPMRPQYGPPPVQYGPPQPQYGPPQPQYQRGPAPMPMHQPYQPSPQPVPNGGYPPPRPPGGYPPPPPPGHPYPPGR